MLADKLQSLNLKDVAAITHVYQQLTLVLRDKVLCEQFLARHPLATGGLTQVSLGLLHESQKVRHACAEAINAANMSVAGATYIKKLNLLMFHAFRTTLIEIETERPSTYLDDTATMKRVSHVESPKTLLTTRLNDADQGSSVSLASDKSYSSFADIVGAIDPNAVSLSNLALNDVQR